MDEERLEVEILPAPTPRKFYLLLGKTMGMHIAQTLVCVDEEKAELLRSKGYNLLEIGTPHPDLVEDIEWEVTQIMRRDLAKLLGQKLPTVARKQRSGV